MNGHIAFTIFHAAIVENRCGELLDALFRGGTATVTGDGKLAIVSGEEVERARNPDAIEMTMTEAVALIVADSRHPGHSDTVGAIGGALTEVLSGRMLAVKMIGQHIVSDDSGTHLVKDPEIQPLVVIQKTVFADAVEAVDRLNERDDLWPAYDIYNNTGDDDGPA